MNLLTFVDSSSLTLLNSMSGLMHHPSFLAIVIMLLNEWLHTAMLLMLCPCCMGAWTSCFHVIWWLWSHVAVVHEGLGTIFYQDYDLLHIDCHVVMFHPDYDLISCFMIIKASCGYVPWWFLLHVALSLTAAASRRHVPCWILPCFTMTLGHVPMGKLK